MKTIRSFFRITAVICMAALTCGLLTGCFGNSKSDADTAKKMKTQPRRQTRRLPERIQ